MVTDGALKLYASVIFVDAEVQIDKTINLLLPLLCANVFRSPYLSETMAQHTQHAIVYCLHN